MVYFLTVNYHSIGLIQRLLRSLESQGPDFLLVVVNNSPDDPDRLEWSDGCVEILESGSNVGFGAACTIGLTWISQQCPGATVWLINPDAYLRPGALAQLHAFLAHYPTVSILGTQIYDEAGKLLFAGGNYKPCTGAIWEEQHPPPGPWSETGWVSGCSMVLQLAFFPSCPSFDPSYFLYYEDFDFCRRYHRQGHRIVIAHQVGVTHQTSAITSRDPDQKIRQAIESYLRALARYAPIGALGYRLLRISLTALGQIICGDSHGRAKLQGVERFLRSGLG